MHTFTRVLSLRAVSLSGTVLGLTLTVLLAVLLATGCSPVIKASGYKPNAEQMAQLKPGQQDRQDVAEILGSPSSISNFKPETWFYISKKTERIAFLAPELKESQILSLVFDERGILKDIQTLDAEARRAITPIDRITPTTGTEMGVIEQMIGNFGRFNKAPGSGGAPKTGSPGS